MKIRLPHLPRSLLLAAPLAALLMACTPLPPRIGAPSQWIPSPNFDARRPNLVIIHHTSDDTMAQALRTLTTPERKVSAHYLIDRDGTILQLVDESARAWHAGKSWWGGDSDINSASIGIELDNNGSEPFADAQIDALLLLLADIRQRNNIPAANFIGHADVAPTRKDDPSPLFPWQRLAEHGFGLWCDAPWPPAPAGYDLALALSALGYDPATPEASRHAFRSHFGGGFAGNSAGNSAGNMAGNMAGNLTGNGEPISAEQEQALAYCLLQKKALPPAP